MTLQMVWNECVRFGGHVNIQVSYKILWLEVLKKALILHNQPCFQKGCFDEAMKYLRLSFLSVVMVMSQALETLTFLGNKEIRVF
jgi:hypothetical protein